MSGYYRVVFAAQVLELDLRSRGGSDEYKPVPLTKPQAGIEVWGEDPDDALERAEEALSELVRLERDGRIIHR